MSGISNCELVVLYLFFLRLYSPKNLLFPPLSFSLSIFQYTYSFCNREYVVDLVGEPGNIHGPDSSINGGLLSPMPSPFQISHLKEYQQPYMDNASSCQILNSKHICAPENPLHSGMSFSADHTLWSACAKS